MFGRRQRVIDRLGFAAVLAAMAVACRAPAAVDPLSRSAAGGTGASTTAGSSPHAIRRSVHHQTFELDLERVERTFVNRESDASRVAVDTFVPIESETSFREVLPSWNIDVPSGCFALVEVRVRRQDGGRWSPWLFVGEWGDHLEFASRTRSLVTTFGGGRVATDMVRADVALDGAQLRVCSFASAHDVAGVHPAVAVRRATLCLSAGRVPIEALERGAGVRAPLALDVPFRSQRGQEPDIAGRVCSPTSVAMVLQYHGIDVAVDEVARRAFDPRHDIYGNWPRNVQAAWTLGVAGHLARFDDWRAVADCFERGLPLVVSIGVEPGELTGAPYTQTSGHLIVLRGFDAAGDLLVNDPAAVNGQQGQVVYARGELERVWLARGGTAYVFEPRQLKQL